MGKIFNITGVCIPTRHYMVDISRQLGQIRTLIDQGAYFTINRARQYGKTTTLYALNRFLGDDYLVVNLDFQALDTAKFADGNIFSLTFARYFLQRIYRQNPLIPEELQDSLSELDMAVSEEKKEFSLYDLFQYLIRICHASARPIILIIDEVDSAADNQVFLDFLAQLRNYYLERDTLGTQTFHSVILAGVCDVKNMRRKLRPDDAHKTNSPWNIATRFKVDMSFSQDDIAGMLRSYEADRHTGMDIGSIAGLLFHYTSGYPYLVSALCKLIDEDVAQSDAFRTKSPWTSDGFFAAERMLLSEKNTLFDSLIGKLTDYPELNTLIEKLLFTGAAISYNMDEPAFDVATMFGFIRNNHGTVEISNRIFETRLYNLYLSGAQMQRMDIYTASQRDKNCFVMDGHLNMRHILERFVIHFHDLYKDSDETFIENSGRKLFLLYLRPIINGVGNYYVEAQTRDMARTDVIVDYHGEQFIIEIKIWHGLEYHTRGERQLSAYLDAYHTDKGYMLSFNFNKKKKIGVNEIVVGNKTIIEAVV